MKKPVLMLNVRYDYTFLLETSQEPLVRMLGTPAAEKSHIVLATPHDVTSSGRVSFRKSWAGSIDIWEE